MISKVRIVSFVLAVICILPAILIPAHWGISIPALELETGYSEGEYDEMEFTVFGMLNVYYMLFLVISLFPFVFFTFSSSLSRKGIRSRKRKNGLETIEDRGYQDLFSVNEAPKVTIIVPCYNEALHVSSTITSSYKQDYPGKIEILVVDDGSKDNTWSIGRIFSSEDSDRRIKIIHKPNGGKASALREGIENAEGSILLMTDGDSIIHPGAVSSIVDTFRKYPDAGIVGGYVFIKNTHSGYLTRLQQLEYIITQHLIRLNQSDDGKVLIAPGPIFGMRKDLALALPPVERTIVEDCDLTMSVLSTPFSTRATTEALSYTTAPETWPMWVKQRKRWIYGQFQAWRENRWHLKRNPWGLYTYFTWAATTFSAVIFILAGMVTLGYTLSGNGYYDILGFISLRTFMVLVIYTLSRMIVLLQYNEGRKWIHYLPMKVIYDMVNGFLTAYLFARYLLGFGVRMRWGQRSGVVH